MSVLIFVEAINGKLGKAAFEVTAYGRKIADSLGTEAVVLAGGDASNIAELGNYGAKKVLNANTLHTLDNQVLTRVIAKAATELNSKVIVLSHDLMGKAVAPRLAAKLNAGLVSGACDYPNTNGGFKVKKAVFSGKAFAEFSINTDVKIITLNPNTFGPIKNEGTAEVSAYAVDAALTVSKIKIKETKVKEGEISLPEAELVVSAGRGMKGPENWGGVEELAKILGAATACSRPVADIGWRPHHEHVGQTGVTVAPNLYIAIGISGAIQHLAGVNRSKVIVVINKDAEAPFFKAADYGIVGDAFEVLPKLIAAAKEFKASSN